MSTSALKAKKLIELFSKTSSFEDTLSKVVQNDGTTKSELPSIPGPISWSREAHDKRMVFLEEVSHNKFPHLFGQKSYDDPQQFQGNIENFVGMTQVPTGIIGPLLIKGTAAQGFFFVPLATTEGALVASYNRGAKAVTLSGGVVSVCLTEGLQRAPLFRFNNLKEVGAFMFWTLDRIEIFQEIVGRTSRYAKLEDMKINMEGNQVVLIFEYQTGDAAGQNMVTLCTDAVCEFIIANSPIKPKYWFIESNYSGDKKATAVSFTSVRGKKVIAEATIKKEVVRDVLGSSPEKIAAYWQASSVTAVQSGSIGIQGHFANGLTALFMATGQDVACVSEAYVGITRMETDVHGDLYVSVTLPSLVVGTVGGGTGLSTQKECLELLGCFGAGHARKFAEICGATILAGELSIAAAIASGNFSKAHKIFGRKK
jgi:hydroxymethylglutaryl-CoA reductase (NADPH)